MKVSVVIPCRNSGPWIGQALLSVARQTHTPFEIITVDDGSTDDTVERVRQTGVQTKILQVAFGNAAAARNAGIDAALGEWIAFQDSDDVWYPDHLARAARSLSGSADIAYLCHSDQVLPDGQWVEMPPSSFLSEPTTGLSDRQFFSWYVRKRYFVMPACIIRRDRLLDIGGLDPSQSRRHDFDMWLRAIRGHTWSFDPVASLAFRMRRPGSLSGNLASCEYFFLRALVKNAADYAGPEMQHLLAAQARYAMLVAFMDGDVGAPNVCLDLARPFLSHWERFCFGAFVKAPRAFRSLNTFRRWLLCKSSHRTILLPPGARFVSPPPGVDV